MIENLISRFERVRRSISTSELERRWKEVRKAMSEMEIEFLLIYGRDRYFGGYVRWFTDFPSELYPTSIIFPIEGDMTLIKHGGSQGPSPPPSAWLLRGVKDVICVPVAPTVNFLGSLDAKEIVEYLRIKRPRVIGIVGKNLISAAFHECLKSGLLDVKIVDFTETMDVIRAVKSEEELRLIKESATIQDLAMEAVLNTIKPHKREIEILAEVHKRLIELGSEEQWIRVGSAPPGRPATPQPLHFLNRRLRDNDQFFIMIESNESAGYWTELGRTICIGKVPKELEDAWEEVKEAQVQTLKFIKPRADPREILKVHNELLKSKGYPVEKRIYAHGQGLDLMERPLFRLEETMKLSAGMNLAVHPTIVTDKAYAWICENYIVTETGVSEALHKTPKEILCVE